MSNIVLDASAVVALLRGETGSEAVAVHLGDAAASTVNIAEAYGRLLREALPPEGVRKDIDELGLDVHSFDSVQAYLAGRMEPETRPLGLSLGDRACLALALDLGLPVLTGDRQWLKASVGVDIRLFR